MVITIDGPAGSGKSTTAREVARQLGFLYIDTGAMYRAVAFAFLQDGRVPNSGNAAYLLSTIQIDLKHKNGEQKIYLNGRDVSFEIRSSEAGIAASKVATLQAVREKLVDEQRRIADEYELCGGGVVIDGRDIGTVVFPDAPFKFFLVADESIRARRRFDEIQREKQTADYQQILGDIRHRDKQDYERTLAPLCKAENAIEIDTSNMTIEEQVIAVLNHIGERF